MYLQYVQRQSSGSVSLPTARERKPERENLGTLPSFPAFVQHPNPPGPPSKCPPSQAQGYRLRVCLSWRGKKLLLPTNASRCNIVYISYIFHIYVIYMSYTYTTYFICFVLQGFIIRGTISIASHPILKCSPIQRGVDLGKYWDPSGRIFTS